MMPVPLPAAEQARLRQTVASLGLNQAAVALARTACFQDFIGYGPIYGHNSMHQRQPFVHNFLFPAALA